MLRKPSPIRLKQKLTLTAIYVLMNIRVVLLYGIKKMRLSIVYWIKEHRYNTGIGIYIKNEYFQIL